eukprot:scaffold2113_cov393-Prasinococcus_capsulatus_cf.AAC.1
MSPLSPTLPRGVRALRRKEQESRACKKVPVSSLMGTLDEWRTAPAANHARRALIGSCGPQALNIRWAGRTARRDRYLASGNICRMR